MLLPANTVRGIAGTLVVVRSHSSPVDLLCSINKKSFIKTDIIKGYLCPWYSEVPNSDSGRSWLGESNEKSESLPPPKTLFDFLRKIFQLLRPPPFWNINWDLNPWVLVRHFTIDRYRDVFVLETIPPTSVNRMDSEARYCRTDTPRTSVNRMHCVGRHLRKRFIGNTIRIHGNWCCYKNAHMLILRYNQ